ncbi:MAG: hypothetical protein PCFJNLEI_00508 [Verrucomicrobiae bacterium]|nr:hypothetical protein [Verrucomicrobiae bacterium]
MFEIGICTAVTTPPPAGDFIEENVQRYLRPEQPDFTPVPTALPVRAANCFLPGTLKCVGTTVDQARLIAYATTAFHRAQQAGIELIVFGSGAARQIPDGFSRAKAEAQFVTYLKEIAPLADRHGVTLVIEPLNAAECNFILSVPEADTVAQACGHPRIAILADFYHMLQQDQAPDDIRRHSSRLRHIHVAEKAKRTAPGLAGDDFRPYLRALNQIGYRGRLALECIWQDYANDVRTGVAELRRQLTAADA